MTTSEPFDVSKFAAELVQQNIKSLLAAATNFAKGTATAVERKLRSSFTDYILNSASHYGTVHTFFIRDTRMPLYNYYVPLDLASGKSQFQDASVARIFGTGNRALIAGRAGCGKSTLMRHFFLDSIRDGKRIPIFIELNQVNEAEDVDLWAITLQSMSKHGLKLDMQQLKLSVKDGGFALLFDGLDEVHEGHRKTTIDQIEQIAALSDKNLTIISSRPDDATSQLKSFSSFEILPLSLEKALELVRLVPFDDEIKKKFADALKVTLYEKHKTFLANPLLLSIMLLTYGQSASIPNKISIFFNQAFEALYQTHDAYKGGFARKRSTDLDIQEFERAFAAFCLLSYDSSSFTFTRTECLEFLTKAKPLAQVDYSSQSFLKDCLQSVCLLMQDGLKIAFVHRSFQEYFAAKCITRLEDSAKSRLLKRFGARSRTDNVLDRYWELDRRSLEILWLIPSIEILREQTGIKRKVSLRSYLKYLRILCDGISVDGREPPATPTLRISYSNRDSASDAMRNMIFLVYNRYWKKLDKTGKTETETFKKHLPDIQDSIKTSELRSNSANLRTLAACPWVLGIDFFQYVVDLPAELNRKRETELESIESILNLQVE